MSIITIVGAGMMGSAMSFPLRDNNHEVRLVGTHLDREVITAVKQTGFHPTLKRKLPAGIHAFQLEQLEQALIGVDLIIGGVSSFGIDWFTEKVVPQIPSTKPPVLMVTKGLQELEDGSVQPFPEHLKKDSSLSFNAIGGPCTSYELADQRHSAVAFCGDDRSILVRLKGLLETPYYHISLSTDVIGVESAVALKNAYALGITLAIGQVEKDEGVGCMEAYNPQAAIFGQSTREMTHLVRLFGGKEESLLYGVSDLYVTVFGGRTRKLGILLGRGLSFAQAMQELEDITLESVVITTRIARALRNLAVRGLAKVSDFPLLTHIDQVINQGKLVDIPWKQFYM